MAQNTMTLDNFNAAFAAKVSYIIDNFTWNEHLEEPDKARFATAIALNSFNVIIIDENSDIIKICK